jgi:electron transfer flavoprotein beta subunit
MNTVVCIKQIPEEIRINRTTYTLVREGIKGIINACDKNAIELALDLREKHGGMVTLLSMGPQDVENTLMHGLAMGADRAILLCDSRFAGADTLATARSLSNALRKLGDFQLVLCGKESDDSGTQQVGPQIANYLRIDQVTYVVNLIVEGTKVRATRRLRNEYETVEAELPVLATVVKGMNRPRIPTYIEVYEAADKEILRWSGDDIGMKEGEMGLRGSSTRVESISAPDTLRECKMLRGSLQENCERIVSILKVKELV